MQARESWYTPYEACKRHTSMFLLSASGSIGKKSRTELPSVEGDLRLMHSSLLV